MFLSFKDTQEKIDYLRQNKDNLNEINISWLLNTLEQTNRKAERYEGVISNIANIDAGFLSAEGEEQWDDKEALKKIDAMVSPIWEEVSTRKGQFPHVDKDWIALEKEREGKA